MSHNPTTEKPQSEPTDPLESLVRNVFHMANDAVFTVQERRRAAAKLIQQYIDAYDGIAVEDSEPDTHLTIRISPLELMQNPSDAALGSLVRHRCGEALLTLKPGQYTNLDFGK